MDIQSFLAHYAIQENPFSAEEARLDPVFDRLAGSTPTHPDYTKIIGQIDRPAAAVIFGEKGSGKTAIRLQMAKHIAEHNAVHPDRRVLAVAYDDLNPMLDNVLRASAKDTDVAREGVRLQEHQDAILSLAVTKLVSGLLGEADETGEAVLLPENLGKIIKALPRQDRVDLAVLAALYDQPRSGRLWSRWRRLRAKLRLGRLAGGAGGGPIQVIRLAATFLSIVAAGLMATTWFLSGAEEPKWLLPLAGVTLAAAVVVWGYWLQACGRFWCLGRHLHRHMPAIDRRPGELRRMFASLGPGQLARQPLPTRAGASSGDSRYQLTRRLVELLRPFGYVGLIVLVDRVDEPPLINGDAQKMRDLVWPMLDNKFLQQEGVGLKLLLPIELRHLLHRESAEFYQEARLDKQNLIDRLIWSGATLYDLCTHRLRACCSSDADSIALTDLFAPDVSRQILVGALDQMHQPRDAFKFLYDVIQEHCRLAPGDDASFKIARLTCDAVRRTQSQRVQELHRGLAPA